MSEPEQKAEIDALIRRVVALLEGATDMDIPTLVGDGILDEFLRAIAKPKVAGRGTPYEYLLANKNRLHLLALLRLAITRNYGVRATVGTQEVFVSPTELQWYPDGVMFVQGTEPFTGILGLYDNGQVKFGIAARDAQGGDALGKDDFLFLDPDEIRRRSEQAAVPTTAEGLDLALQDLDRMLAKQESAEAVWQAFFRCHPWIFGLEYKQIDSHTDLDDDRIPDFTGVRAHDSARDIIEIKPPTLPLFQQNDEFRAEFHRAWNQAERYLDFTRREADYLCRQKGLRFDNPYCYLIAGYNLTRRQLDSVRLKERLNPAVRFRTYNDIRAVAANTVALVNRLRRGDVEQARAGAGAESTAPDA